MIDLIIRHRKENKKKCSLRNLEHDPRVQFTSYPFIHQPPKLENYLLLAIDGPELCAQDAHYPLLLIDSTWRYAQRIRHVLPPIACVRSLPKGWQTAYPRRQEVTQGLASLEALFIAWTLLGRSTHGLLDGYLWAGAFLEKNHHLMLDSHRAQESLFLQL